MVDHRCFFSYDDKSKGLQWRSRVLKVSHRTACMAELIVNNEAQMTTETVSFGSVPVFACRFFFLNTVHVFSNW